MSKFFSKIAISLNGRNFTKRSIFSKIKILFRCRNFTKRQNFLQRSKFCSNTVILLKSRFFSMIEIVVQSTEFYSKANFYNDRNFFQSPKFRRPYFCYLNVEIWVENWSKNYFVGRNSDQSTESEGKTILKSLDTFLRLYRAFP